MTRKPLQARLRSLHRFVRNVLALTVWWSIPFALVPVARRASSEWPSIPVALLLACTIGIGQAWWSAQDVFGTLIVMTGDPYSFRRRPAADGKRAAGPPSLTRPAFRLTRSSLVALATYLPDYP